jgi:hypothetical protein
MSCAALLYKKINMSSEKKETNHSLWNILKILLAFMLVGFILSRTNLGELAALSHRIDLLWLLVGFLLFLLLTLLKALQYYYLISPRVEYPHVLNVVVIQNAMSNFIATGAGIASYLTLFRVEQGVKVRRAVLVFLLTKVGDLISIWLFMLISSLLLWNQVIDFQNWIILSLVFLGMSYCSVFSSSPASSKICNDVVAYLGEDKTLTVWFCCQTRWTFFSALQIKTIRSSFAWWVSGWRSL